MKREHILLLEDDPSLRTGIQTMLEDEFPEYKIEAVESAEKARQGLRKSHRHNLLTRVVIVDEDLGGGERGSEFLRYLRRYYPGVRKIMLEARARPKDISRAVNEGDLDRYIHKSDFEKDHNLLFDAIRSALSEGEGVLYDSIVELLQEAAEGESEDAAILMAGPSKIRTEELLRDIVQQTRRGRTHMREFTKLLYSFFLNPEDFIREMDSLRKKQVRQKGGGKKSGKDGK